MAQAGRLIVQGIADDHFCRVLREDPARAGLLYLGTEFGLYISFDAGASWQRFQLNLPISPIYDLKIKGDDLIVATHGRSFWILDDLTVLHQLATGEAGDSGWLAPYKDLEGEAAHLLKPATTERWLPKMFEGLFESGEGKQYMGTLGAVAAYVKEETPEHGVKYTYLDSGVNPPSGAVITYYLREGRVGSRRHRPADTAPSKPEATITLRIDDEDGNEVKTFKSLHADEEDAGATVASPSLMLRGRGRGTR